MVTKSVILLGAAVHTRGIEPGQDYAWSIKIGDLQLFEKMDKIYRIALCDVNSEVPKLAVVIEQRRISLLMGDMPCPRIDHSNRVIYDTLYLEFDSSYQQSILPAIAVLLLDSKSSYRLHEQYFADYAEQLFYHAPAISHILGSIELPAIEKSIDMSVAPIRQEKLALFSNRINQYRCASHLIQLTLHDESRFCFISTGRVNLEKCRQVSEYSDECILLTLSSEIHSEVDLKPNKFFNFRQFIKNVISVKFT